jgi:hypothetical protein
MNKVFAPGLCRLLIAASCILLYSCAKEYSYEGGFVNGSATGTAVYTLVGEGGNCPNPVVSGVYNDGLQLTSANTVQLQVDVDSVGTYQVTTSANDGFSFSASGTFTTTGIQKISLTANGTPSADGDFAFNPPVGLGCNFIITVTQAPPAIAQFTFSGAPGKCTNIKVQGNYTSGHTLDATNDIVITVDVTSPGAYNITTDTLDGISFSLSGSFTTSGMQTVTIPGSGRPTLARNLTFTFSAPGISGCSFDLGIIDPDPLATYVLESGVVGTSSECIYAVQGSVTANLPLNVGNSVSIRVYVTVPGNFTIATAESDGIVFSYSGVFTDTGVQYVVLKGNGTPVNPGTFTFAPNIVGPHPLGGQACAFDITVL